MVALSASSMVPVPLINAIKSRKKVYGVMGTPALVIDEEVKTVGKVLTVDQIKKYL